MSRGILLFTLAIALCLLPGVTVQRSSALPPPDSAATGAVEGTITYESDRRRPWRYQRYYVKGRSEGPLAEAVVALKPLDEKPAEAEEAKSQLHTIDQKDFRFNPETLAIRAGDRVKFTNSDGALHNVFTPSKIHKFDINLRQGNENIQTFETAGGTETPVRLRCIFHSTMQAWIYVFDRPYFQVTAADGKFNLKDVPPGAYELIVVHPAGELKTVRKLEVTAGKANRQEIRVSPDDKVESEDATK